MQGYNCNSSQYSAYGSGTYGTCTNQSVGAPNTGVFQEIVSSGSFTIIAPLVTAVIVVVIATVVMNFRKRSKASQISEN